MQSDEAEVDMDELVRLLRQGPYDGLLHKILARWPRISADELDRAMDVAAEQMIQAARGHADPRLRAASRRTPPSTASGHDLSDRNGIPAPSRRP